ncbi:hypothetical protein QJS04_geneDACA021213 [Acorus gramineus]|uniref:Uncharacterized protein n=1 Tax=Acorus gramineus TaxID=55184 RepID=A0AAV9AHK7_ACOGR|nr:hypothetical protein QJS04_geneDACA021213 [Acorus gramineus]
MGSASSKAERSDALFLCKERRRLTKQAIDSRYALAATHLSYVQSLRSIGTALRRFAEAEVLIESSLSTSATEPDRTPSHSSYASPSPSHIAEVVGSPLENGGFFSPRVSNVSCMRSGGSAPLTVRVNPSMNHFVEDESLTFPMPPPPPPLPHENGPSWDFFNPMDSINNGTSDIGGNGRNFNGTIRLRQFKEEEVVPFNDEETKWVKFGTPENNGIQPTFDSNSYVANGMVLRTHSSANGSAESLFKVTPEKCSLKRDNATIEKETHMEREVASEFITHRAKDFLSSMKDIEHRFFRAAEAGQEVSRMLEASKIQFTWSEMRDSEPHVEKVITWNRSLSSVSSSSRNPLATASKDDNCESGSDFIEEFCMIAGSHSSTLDRLYAWERKLYDEVKASETIRKEYDRKCSQLRHQFAKDMNARVIDKTRAVVKDLHSQVKVTIHSVESISKRIEKLRDEELLPQLLELMQGFIRMWRAMLECHHAQYITISLAYHVRTSAAVPHGETYRQVLMNLQHEIDCFSYSIAHWVDAHKSYVEALNGWLQNCILQPQQPAKGSKWRRRMTFPPSRAVAPPMFVLCQDWLAGIKALEHEELINEIKSFQSELRRLIELQAEETQMKQSDKETASGGDDKDDGRGSSLSDLQASLTRLFDRLKKFAEASLKMYEDIRQGSEAARVAYANCKVRL